FGLKTRGENAAAGAQAATAREGFAKKNLDRFADMNYTSLHDAGWSSPVARRAHNPKVLGSNPSPATNIEGDACKGISFSFYPFFRSFFQRVPVPIFNTLCPTLRWGARGYGCNFPAMSRFSRLHRIAHP